MDTVGGLKEDRKRKATGDGTTFQVRKVGI
jgi:hypothetical protein